MPLCSRCLLRHEITSAAPPGSSKMSHSYKRHNTNTMSIPTCAPKCHQIKELQASGFRIDWKKPTASLQMLYVTVGEQYQRTYSANEASVHSKSENSHLFVGNEGTDGQTRDTVIFLTMIFFFLHFVLSHTPSVYYSHCLPSFGIPAQLFKNPHKIAHFSGGCPSHRWVPAWKHLPVKDHLQWNPSLWPKWI